MNMNKAGTMSQVSLKELGPSVQDSMELNNLNKTGANGGQAKNSFPAENPRMPSSNQSKHE